MSYYDDFNEQEHKEVSDPKPSGRRVQRKEREAKEQAQRSAPSTNKSKAHKIKINWPKFIRFIIVCGLAFALLIITYVSIVIVRTPNIETSNIYSMLSQSSVLYDENGQIIDNVFASENRTIVDINQIPDSVQKAFIALEDKTFESHHGFNIIRVFGAIKDAVIHRGAISGTSTITQQLARNLYLEDKKSERSLNRKIQEAYYSVILEQKLTKAEILEAYLNTVYFGNGYGVQAASQAYFSKDIEDVTIAESAALAAMPQLPSVYALVVRVSSSEVSEDAENIILKDGDYAYVWNNKSSDRIRTCLKLMLNQGYITQEEYDEAISTEIKDIVNPNIDALNTVSNYFADYVITQVIADLQEEYGYDYSQASNLVYNGGIQIYTTMDSQAQSVIEKEFKKDDNFPKPTSYEKDRNGNIINSNGGVLLYAFDNYIEEDGSFKLKPEEFQWNPDGSLTIFSGKRLAIYNTTVQGTTDYSVEFRSMYTIEKEKFYSISGGYINIPQIYKSKDSNGNLVISSQFFTDYPNFFVKEGEKLSTKDYSLKQKTIQPQAAMTIIDNRTGAIKAMIGGRNINGRMLFNRATSTRQPGSSIKPLAVYASALQKSFELQAENQTFTYTNTGFDQQGTTLWGNYITTASIVDDEPTTINNEVWPVNSYRSYKGLYTFRTALQQSVNVCAVKILSQVGVDYAFQTAEKFGLTSLVKEGANNDVNLAALGMGGLTNGVSTLEMASAYSTFVNDGIHKSYSCYTKVTTKHGDLLLETTPTETEVLDSGVAWIMRDVLQTVVSEGIGSYAKVSGANVGGKTGTTSDSYDIWFDGFTANYSASIWIGNDVNIKLSSMSPKAATLWGKIMGQIDNAKGGTYSNRPENVVTALIDTKSGLLATEDSNYTRTEYFTNGTQPSEGGSLLKTVPICNVSGALATASCQSITYKTGIMRPYIPNKRVKDIGQELPHYYCHLHNPNPAAYPADPNKQVTIVDPVVVPENPSEDTEDVPQKDPIPDPIAPEDFPGEDAEGTSE